MAMAWPVLARAQQSGAMRRIAVLGVLAPGEVEAVARNAAFEQSLAALVGRRAHYEINYRWIANAMIRARAKNGS